MISREEFKGLFEDFVPVQEKDEMWNLIDVINKEVVDETRSFHVLETGLLYGGSTRVWHRFCENQSMKSRLIGIDRNPIRARCMLELSTADSFFIKADSTTDECFDYTKRLIEETDENNFDFIFLDADHRKESVIKEFKLYLPLLKKGGLIAVHDYKDPNSGTRAAVVELKQEGLLKPTKEGECISKTTLPTMRGIWWAII